MNRIREIRRRQNLSQQALAELAGTSAPQINRLEKGERRLTQEWLERLGAALHVDPWELIEKEGEIEPHQPDHPPLYNGTLMPGFFDAGGTEYASIARFDARLSAGPGSLMEAEPEPLGYHFIEGQWLRAITGTAPDYLMVVMVDGDSMEPTFWDRDWVLVDTTQQRVERQGIFALRVGEAAWIKRLQPMLSLGKIRIHSDNDRYDHEDMNQEELAIIGRVVGLVARRV